MLTINPEDLAALARFSTPTISNAIERFGVRPRNQGYMSPEIRCLFPELGVMVGYAVTATVAAEQPAAGTRQASREDYWDYTQTIPSPRIAVIQDLDQPPCIGAFFGEVNANIHKALGFVGAVTNSSVRDLSEVRALGFHFFACCVGVSHAYVHLVDFGTPVKVGGLIVSPGDLLHADQHGVILIPKEIAHDIITVAKEIEEAERRLIAYCRSSDFTLDGLKPLARETRARIEGKR